MWDINQVALRRRGLMLYVPFTSFRESTSWPSIIAERTPQHRVYVHCPKVLEMGRKEGLLLRNF
eukprot:jgi/Botrbrau1/9167/Bobra.160_3s0039.1